MPRYFKFALSLAGLSLLISPALAQPVPGGGPYQQGPGPMPPHFHHHWQNHPYFPPISRWRPGERFYGPPPIIIHNYGYYRLTPPPPGYYWVQSGGQFLMIAIGTGIIVSILTMPMH